MARFTITTAIDYTNGVIHIGHAYQKIVADVLARFHKQIDDEVYFLTGTDEHGITNTQAAAKEGLEPRQFVDKISALDKKEIESMDIRPDRFIRTTDEDHKKVVAEFYMKSFNNGDIYKGSYEGLYCAGCESYKTLSELIDGACPLHPTRTIEKISEENYFFRWSKYRDFLRDLIENNPLFVQPEQRRKDMIGFLDSGLEDIAISRPKQKLSWGIPVPNDESHVIYVWFDALINYVTGLGSMWPASLHLVGKDITRWHTLLWPAMLKSAGYEMPKAVYSHGFMNLNGQKISKSLGNVISPSELANRYGSDATRYYFFRYGPWVEDVDVSLEKIDAVYQSDLANGIGNLSSRLTTMAEKEGLAGLKDVSVSDEYKQFMGELKIVEAVELIWSKIKECDRTINETKLWEKTGEEKEQTLNKLLNILLVIAKETQPIMPNASLKIIEALTGEKIVKIAPLFPRI